MLKTATFCSLVVIFSSFFTTPIMAQDTTGQSLMAVNGWKISGTFKPKGPPLTPLARENVGGSCIVDISKHMSFRDLFRDHSK